MHRLFSYIRSLWPYGLLLLIVIGLYGQSLGFGYVWDDNPLFLDNTLLREGRWSWESIARPVLPGTSYFRPLVLASWMAEMQLFQLTPAYSHAINLMLHGINTCLLYTIACRVFERYQKYHIAALWAALLYTVHPCLVEGVAWISGRFDVLATALLMAGCAVAMARATMARCIWLALFSLGSMLSKEIGVLLAPILILLTLARFPQQSIKTTLLKIWPYLIAYAIAAATYFLLRRQGLGYASYSEFGIPQIVESLLNYQEWVRKLSFYTFISFSPFGILTPRHDWIIELTSYRQHMTALLASLLLMILVIFFALRRHAWATLWLGFYIGIFPVLGIVSIAVGETIGAERFLYLPLTMLSLASVELFYSIKEKCSEKRMVLLGGGILAGGWLLLSIFVTYTVASMWESGLRLWSWQYHLNPENKLVRASYLLEISKTKTPEANAEFEQEIEHIKERNGGRLPTEVQIVYANYLLGSMNPESIYYLRGLVDSMPVSLNKYGSTKNGQWSEELQSGVFSNYAQALVIFEGNLKEARKYLEKAEKLEVKGFEFNIIHQIVALNYMEGNELLARKIYHDNFGLLQAYNIEKMKISMGALVEGYCMRGHDVKFCENYVENFYKIIEAN